MASPPPGVAPVIRSYKTNHPKTMVFQFLQIPSCDFCYWSDHEPLAMFCSSVYAIWRVLISISVTFFLSNISKNSDMAVDRRTYENKQILH